MIDDQRPPARSLQREVEPPRTAAALWLPLMALIAAAMLTVASGVAVMARPSHRPPPTNVVRSPSSVPGSRAPADGDPRCRGPIYRATADDAAGQFEHCTHR